MDFDFETNNAAHQARLVRAFRRKFEERGEMLSGREMDNALGITLHGAEVQERFQAQSVYCCMLRRGAAFGPAHEDYILKTALGDEGGIPSFQAAILLSDIAPLVPADNLSRIIGKAKEDIVERPDSSQGVPLLWRMFKACKHMEVLRARHFMPHNGRPPQIMAEITAACPFIK